MYDYGARNYDPALGRWMNMDPMTEKYFGASPYNYVLNSPVNAVDPDGMDVYLLTESGRTILALKEKDKNTDTMFAVSNSSITDISSSSGTKDTTSIFDMKDTNGDGQFTKEDGVTVRTGLIGQLSSYRSGSEVSGQKYYSSIGKQSDQNEKDYLGLFKYLADNTTKEYSLTFFNNKGNDYIELATYLEHAKAPSARNLGYGIDNSDVKWHGHNHPDGYATERSSMGERPSGNTLDASDGGNAVSEKVTYPNRVYFPKSGNLYNVTQYGIKYIENINKSTPLKR